MAHDHAASERERQEYEHQRVVREADKARRIALVAEGALRIISSNSAASATSAQAQAADALAVINALKVTSA